MKSMLDRCMERNLDCTKDQAARLADRYLQRLKLADELFDGRPFSLRPPRHEHGRPVAGIYDGVMIALDGLWPSRS